MKGSRWALAICLSLCINLGLVASAVPAESSDKMAMAMRSEGTPPRIDGVLDDEVWKTAPVSDDFLQRDPIEGVEVTERTAFQIVYDEEALYIGIRCYDSDPEGIISRLTRRDGETEADRSR